MRVKLLRRMLVLAAGIALVAAAARPAQAFPTSGGGHANCLGCHATQREAALPSFLELTARPGDLVRLTINLTNGESAYSASLAGLGAPGLAGFTPDASWANHFTAGTYNTDPQYGGPYYALSDSGLAYQGPVSHFFDMQLSPNTQLGTYPLTFTVAGSGTEGRWRDANPFTLNVIPEPPMLALIIGFAALGPICWRRRRRKPDT
jgi:hypothetical protein